MRSKQDDVLYKLSENAKISLRYAGEISKQMASKEIRAVHIFLGILLNDNSLASKVLQLMGIDALATLKSVSGREGFDLKSSPSRIELILSKEAKEILRNAYSIASSMAHVYVGTEHLVLSMLSQKTHPFTKSLVKQGLTFELFEENLMNFATYPLGILAKPKNMKKGKGMESSALDIFGVDITGLAKNNKLDPIVGRGEELEQIVNILSRRKKNNPVIVGEAGVGKTALVEALAQRIADGNVPLALKDSRIIMLDINSILAGSRMRGDVEEKMMAIVAEVSKSKDVILFIDEIHTIISSGMPGTTSDIASVLKPALTRDGFRCIGATTTAEYTRFFEEDNALVRRFQPVLVEETDIKDSIQILRRIRPILEKHHKVKVAAEAIESAVKLSHRYVSDRYLPDKAIDLLDEASATRKLEVESEFSEIPDLMSSIRVLEIEKDSLIKASNMKGAKAKEIEVENLRGKIKKLEKKRDIQRKSKEYEVNSDTVKKVVSKWTGIPMTTLGSDERSSLLNLEKSLEKSVVGQSEAVEAVSNAIKRARTGISAEDRPWASFLFLGPTGVGKTELAKAVTKELFGSEDRLIQIDMSEMMEMHSVSKLIGSPPGYVGYREGGQLTEQIRQQPHSVILFDEIEKAHIDVLNILLQILEYGHLTDGKG